MFCTLCGKQLADDAQFCDNCGAPLQMQSAPLSVNPDEPATPGITWEDAIAGQGKKKKLWLPAVIGILVLAIVITGGFFLFGKKTVYLQTEITTDNVGRFTSIIRKEYDDNGNLLSRTIIQEHPDEDDYSGYTYTSELRYEYDKNGTLEYAEMELSAGDEYYLFEIEYTYNKGILDGITVDCDEMPENTDYDFTFTDEGWIKRVAYIQNDMEYMVYTYRYHDNGKLKTAESEYRHIDRTTKNSYDEQGRVIENATYINDELFHKMETEYIENTTIPSKVVSISYNDGKETERSTTRIESVTKGGKVTELSIVVENVEDGEKTKVTLSGDVDWDGLEATWEPRIKGDLEAMGYEGDSLEVEFEKDKHGNLIRYEIIMDGETQQIMEAEYIAIKVPRDYETPNTIDPIYLTWLSN